MKNRMVIHNHPNGCSFSIDDIQNIIRFDAFIFHVITEDSIYTVKRPESGWKISVDFKKEPIPSRYPTDQRNTGQNGSKE